jgi:antitoxin HicB
MYSFPAKFEAGPDGGFVVTFRDIPEAITQADTMEEAEMAAIDALITAMDFYFEDRRPVPPPSKAVKGECLVGLPVSVSIKVALLNAMLETNTRPVDLARAMNIRPQEVNRVIDLKHSTKVDTMSWAFAAVGKKLEFVVR